MIHWLILVACFMWFIDTFIRHAPWYLQVYEWVWTITIVLLGWGLLHLIAWAVRCGV